MRQMAEFFLDNLADIGDVDRFAAHRQAVACCLRLGHYSP